MSNIRFAGGYLRLRARHRTSRIQRFLRPRRLKTVRSTLVHIPRIATTSTVLNGQPFFVLPADFNSNQAHQIALIAVLSRALSRVPDIHMRQRVRYARRTEVSDKRTKVRLYRAICDNVALRRAV